MDSQDLVYRLKKRAEIRRQISTRKSVQEGAPDRIADLLEEAATEITSLRALIKLYNTDDILSSNEYFTAYPMEEYVADVREPLTENEVALAFLTRAGIDLSWQDVPEQDWDLVIAAVKNLKPEPDECCGSLHCYDEVYAIGLIKYTLTYEDTGGDRPILIQWKKV